MKRLIGFLAILSLAASAVSCNQTVSSGLDTIPYVKSIIADKDGYENNLLSSISTDSRGTIAIIGDSLHCATLLQVFLECDFFDNIDGRKEPDDLPDFSGEKVVALSDVNFQARIQTANAEGLREFAVKSFISAMDTSVRAKAVIISSPWMATEAVFDIDSLKHFFRLDVPVIYPIRTASAYVTSKFGKNATVAVFSDDEAKAESGLYGRFFDNPYSVCTDQPADSVSFRVFLENYSKKSNPKKLNAVIIDDYSVDTDAIYAEIDEIINKETPENLALRQLLSVDFELVDCRDIAAEACFREFRNKNIFTHNVAYPIGLTLNVQN